MDRNLLLAFALAFLVLMLWSVYQRGAAPPLTPERSSTPEVTQEDKEESSSPLLPQDPADSAGDAERDAPPKQSSSKVVPAEPEKLVRISLPLYEAELSSRGAGITRWWLTKYRTSRSTDSPPVTLTTLDPTREVGLATPFLELNLGDLSLADFRVEQPDPLQVVFTIERGNVVLRKIYHFSRDSYIGKLRIEIDNRSDDLVRTSFEVVWPGRASEAGGEMEHGLAVLHTGSVKREPWVTPGFLACGRGGGAKEERQFSGEVDWIGEEQRYFIAAVLPELPREAVGRFVPNQGGHSGSAVLAYRPVPVPPGQVADREYRFYIGPKEHEQLVAAGGSLENAINLGWSWVAPLTRFFGWLLRTFHTVIPNYGVAIILITLMVRVVTAPLTAKQMRSMKKMGELQPKIKELQEKYKDDRQRQSQEMMSLYKQTGVNPLGGCLPMLLQFPVFIGLYYALQSSIELRQASFVAWIDDLSVPETLFVIPGVELPFRVLPILMGLSMIAQQRMTPSTMDPAQAKMMMTVMPVMFTLLFYQFPSGLVLYWLVSNILAISHQVLVNRGSRKKTIA